MEEKGVRVASSILTGHIYYFPTVMHSPTVFKKLKSLPPARHYITPSRLVPLTMEICITVCQFQIYDIARKFISTGFEEFNGFSRSSPYPPTTRGGWASQYHMEDATGMMALITSAYTITRRCPSNCRLANFIFMFRLLYSLTFRTAREEDLHCLLSMLTESTKKSLSLKEWFLYHIGTPWRISFKQNIIYNVWIYFLCSLTLP